MEYLLSFIPVKWLQTFELPIYWPWQISSLCIQKGIKITLGRGVPVGWVQGYTNLFIWIDGVSQILWHCLLPVPDWRETRSSFVDRCSILFLLYLDLFESVCRCFSSQEAKMKYFHHAKNQENSRKGLTRMATLTFSESKLTGFPHYRKQKFFKKN